MTQPDHIWQQIADLMKGATGTVTVIAPFIKKAIFEEAVATVPACVEKIECVTRWAPAEVAAGVSDPEIIEVAQANDRVRIALCPSLHAKLYLAGDRCLVGSANLTGKATGRVHGANLELLVEVPVSHPEVQRVLDQIESTATTATPYMAAFIRQQAELLEAERGTTWPHGEPVAPRYPETRRPETLYALYSGRARYTSPVEAGIIQDLAMLNVPAGLTESEFNAEVEDRLHLIPELHQLLVGERLSNTALQKAIEERAGIPADQAERTTETLRAWLQHFGRYYTAIGSWELRPGREHP